MPEIISVGSSDPNQIKENPLKKLWDKISSLDKFTKMLFVTTLLLVTATPLIVKGIMTLNQHASEGDQPKNVLINKDTKPEYAKGEIIIKLASNLDNAINSDTRAKGVSFEKSAISLNQFDQNNLPQALVDVSSKYKIKEIGRVFKNAKAQTNTLNNLKRSNGQVSQLSLNKDEIDLVKQDRALIYKVSFEDKNTDPMQVIAELRREPDVLYAEPNYIYRATLDPTPTEITTPTLPVTPSPTLTLTPTLVLTPTPTFTPKPTLAITLTPTLTPKPTLSLAPTIIPSANPSITPVLVNSFQDPYYLDHYPDQVKNRDPTWNPQYDYQWNLKKIHAEEAWKMVNKNILKKIKVAVIDSGVDYTHSELGGCTLDQVNADSCPAVAPGYNFVSYNNDPFDDMGHGTHVAGIIDAITNTDGIAGMASGVRIMPLKALDNWGSGYTSNLAQAIYYAVDNGAKVINASWGGAGNSVILSDAVSYAYSKGVVFVAAAGNSNIDATYFSPANITCANSVNPDIDCTLTVASTSNWDSKSWFSNYGSTIDVSAPGEEIISLKSSELNKSVFTEGSLGNNYIRMSGTSMATPHVAALAALILAKNQSLSPKEVRNIILNGADDLGTPSFDNEFGFGRINAQKSLENMKTDDLPVAKISYPIKGMLVGSKFKVYGSASAKNFLEYKVEFLTKDGKQSTEGITVENNGKKQIRDGLLATISINNNTDNWYRTIRLTTKTSDNKEIYTETNAVVDNSLRDGFPLDYGADPIFFPPVVADINNDGKKEIVYQSSKYGKIYALDNNGNNLKGWPVSTGFPPVGVTDLISKDYAPVVADIDPNYPGKEIIVPVADYNYYRVDLLAFHADGTSVKGWTTADWSSRNYIGFPGEETSISAGEVDGKKVIALAESWPPSDWISFGTPFKMHLLDSNGNEMSGWPINLGYLTQNDEPFYDTPSITILDPKDGAKILVKSLSNSILIINTKGQIEKTINVATDKGEYIFKWFVADVNKDGKNEIVASTINRIGVYPNTTNYSKIHIFDSQGVEIKNWPIVIKKESPYWESNSLSLGDFNSDGALEIMSIFKDDIHLLNLSGVEVTGYPKLLTGAKGLSQVGTITSNDNSEVIALTDPSWFGDPIRLINVKNNNFSDISGFPKNFTTGYSYAYTVGSPILDSFDGSGNIDLIAPVYMNYGEGWILNIDTYLYSFKTNIKASSYDWPQWLHDEKHSNTYVNPTPAGVCNKSCKTNVDCSSGYTCYQPPPPTCPPGVMCPHYVLGKVCRSLACPASDTCSSTCPSPTPIRGTCNSGCVTDANCSSGYICYQPPVPTCAPGTMCPHLMKTKTCRNLSCLTAANCSCSIPSPASTALCKSGAGSTIKSCGGHAQYTCASKTRCVEYTYRCANNACVSQIHQDVNKKYCPKKSICNP